ncbi:MAG: hypothetical protein ACOCVF_00525 [bacterium]
MKNISQFEYLITGCGRSGTGYFAKMLTANNIECGHEEYYGIKINSTRKKNNSESSWLAVPYIKNNLNSKIIKIFREPISNIKSTHDRLLFSTKRKDCPFQKHILNYIPEIDIKNKTMIENAALYYIHWNLLFDKLIDNEYYELVHLDSLVIKDNVILYDKKFNTINEVVNKNKNFKLNINKKDVIIKLKKHNLYDRVMEVYSNMLNNKFRKI